MAGDDCGTFGDLVRRVRRAAGLSQEELANRAGLSVRGISDLERGVNRRPRKDRLEMLATALNLTADERTHWEHACRQFPNPLSQTQPIASDNASRTSTALPTRLTSFAGREREIAGLRERLQQPAVRLVTVTETGGVGKTSLAVQVAADMTSTFEDGAACETQQT